MAPNMVVLDSFPFSDVTLIQDEVNSGPSRNESPRTEITIGSSADSAEDVEDTSEPGSTEKPFLRCEKCHYQTKIKSLFHKHITKHMLDSDFQCPVCDFHESNSSLFVDHFATHHDGATLNCHVCHKKFHKSDLKSHIMTHTAVTLYDCSMCKFSTNYIKSIESHTEAFHVKVYKCHHCSLGLTKHELQLHIKSAHDSADLVAESVESVSSSSRKTNEISASTSETVYSGDPGKAPFSCSQCGFSTTYMNSLKRHTEIRHTKENRCTECNQVVRKHDLLQHMKTSHALDDTTNSNENPVGISNQSLQSTENSSQVSGMEVPKVPTRRSLRTTKGLRLHSYQDSGKSALNTATTKTLQTTKKDQKSSLTDSVSSDRHRYSCSVCDYSAKSNCDIRRHTEAWHDNKYSCKECNQVMSKHDLRLHKEASHGLLPTGSNPSLDDAPMSSTKNSLEISKNHPKSLLAYSQRSEKHEYCCSSCDYSSKFGGNLKRHTELMHDKKYRCKECNQVVSKHDLLRHQEASESLQGSCSNLNQDSDNAPSTKNNLNNNKNVPKPSSPHSHSLDKLPYCCPLCNYSTTNERYLDRHTEAWHEKEYNCKECNEVMFRHELLLHMVASHGLLPSQDSGKGAKSHTNSLEDPKSPPTNSQSSNVPFCCPLCNFSSTNKGIYKKHTEAWHDKKYHCEECNQVMSKHDLLLHMETSHGGISNQGLGTTKNTTTPFPAPCNQLIHDHPYVKTSDSLQMPSSMPAASVEIQSLEILENIPKSLSHHSGNSRTAPLEIEPFSFHEFRTKFTQHHANATDDAHSTGHQQHNDEIIASSSNTSTNETHAQQMENNRRKCDFCGVTYTKSHFIKHVGQCAATRLIPDEVGDDNKFVEKASGSTPKNPVAGTHRVASGFDLVRPNSYWPGKWRVVLKRLNLDSSELRSAISGKLRLLVQKKGVQKKHMLHCSKCLFKTNRRILLKKHVAKHLKDFRLACPYCGYKEVSTSMFVKHIAEHQGDKTTFKCCFCDSKPFGNQHSFGEHLRKHRPEWFSDCPKCEYSTFRSDTLRYHVENIHIKKCRCRVCGATMNRFRLGKHMGKAHGLVKLPDHENQVPDNQSQESTTYTYDLSSAHDNNADQAKDLEHQTFATPSEAKPVSETTVFKQAVAKESDSSPEPDPSAENVDVEIMLTEEHGPMQQNPCDSKKITSQASLVKFVKPYFCCSKCSFKTRMKSLLKGHVAKHFIDDRFTCPECGFKESCNRKFARHWFSHNTGSQQMINCCFCTAQYTKQSCLKGSLPWHIERHRVVKLFDCSKCEFSGQDKYALERHHEKHHSKWHYCKVCGKFMTLKRLSKHICQHNRLRLKEPSLSEQVIDRPNTLGRETRSLGNTSSESRDTSELEENHLMPKLCAELEAKPSCSLLVPPDDLDLPGETSCTAVASSSLNADITLNQTDTTTPLAMPCDMDEEYFCVFCKSWVSLDDFAIHQQQCLTTIDTQSLSMNEASINAANTEDRSVDVSLLSFFNESIETSFGQHEASHSLSVEPVNMETGETALGSEPVDSNDISSSALNPGSKVAVLTNPKSRMNLDKDDLVELTSDADATNSKSDQTASEFNSEVAIINVSSDSEDSYGSPYCESELVGEDRSAPLLDFTNVFQDRLKNMLKLPNKDDVLPVCQSMNSENPISSELSHGGMHQLVDSTQRNDYLTSDFRNMSVLQGRDAGSQSYAELCRSDMPDPVEPSGNESILNISSGNDTKVVGLFGHPKWRSMPVSVAHTRPETLPSVSGVGGMASAEAGGKISAEAGGKASSKAGGRSSTEASREASTRQQSLSRRAGSSVSPYPEIGFSPSGNDGRIQSFADISQPSSDPSKDLPVWRFADGQWIISRYVRNTANIKNPSTISH